MVSPQDVAPSRPSIPTAALSSTPSHSVSYFSPAELHQPAVVAAPVEHVLTETQIEAICATMKLFVEDDLARGISASSRIYCDGCERARQAVGVIQYDRYSLCNRCAIEYEVGRARGMIVTPGQYVRDKHFGDGDLYVLPD